MMDEIRHPGHYSGTKVDCTGALKSLLDVQPECAADGPVIRPTAFYWWGCAFKYLWRWSRKAGMKDLLKARQCIGYLLSEVYGDKWKDSENAGRMA